MGLSEYAVLDRGYAPLQFKDAGNGVIEGYASRFNEVDTGNDVVAPGAYAKSLASGRKVKMLWQHSPSSPIGVWDELKEDETGLFVRGRILSEVEKGRETRALIEAGAVDGMSIGYRTVKSSRTDKGGRLLQEVDLWEVSVVTFPMQGSARIDSIKAAKELQKGNSALLKRAIEDTLREAEIPNSQAKAAAAAAVNKLVDMREAGSGLGELVQFMRQIQTGQGE